MIAALAPPGLVVVEADGSFADVEADAREEAYIQSAVGKRRREFRTGRACARAALARFGIEDFAVLPNEDGAPCWPPGMVGSITHTSSYCASAVAREREILGVGIDAETAEPLKEGLARMVCTRSELDRLSSLKDDSAGRWAKLVFSAKESVFKYYYPLARTRLDFADLEIDISPDPGRFAARLLNWDRPAAAGARTFEGRFGWSMDHVFTIVT
jgi:4'-phosphopantetheinyl transferase EntD